MAVTIIGIGSQINRTTVMTRMTSAIVIGAIKIFSSFYFGRAPSLMNPS